MTVLSWKDTAMGQKVIAGLASEKAFAEVLPDEFAMQLRQITASVERLSETAAVVAQVPSELNLATANLVGRASAHLMSVYYPTHQEVPRVSAYWGQASYGDMTRP
ncbi:hypothetical protein EXIGLDRAFT_781422 [Exidia glandulosa HHB12029]|uniref:Uncharacterized protein n=1 Tax=Exidia glandulosa HHB12029 TaxID=1314781 RepID=A0A165B907_EXIGL|nr:hypothetical protein EXIGLDRAFT_781422 [Exidia glandulosa HHB12029]